MENWDFPQLLSDVLKSKNNWNLACDAKLLKCLESVSTKVAKSAASTLQELDSFEDELNRTCVDVSTVNNNFLSLFDSQFLENRIKEEPVNVNNENTAQETESSGVENEDISSKLKEALNNGINLLSSQYRIIEVMGSDSESDGETEGGEVLLKSRNSYSHRKLPYLIGSEKFQNDEYIGLGSHSDEEDENEGDSRDDESDASELANDGASERYKQTEMESAISGSLSSNSSVGRSERLDENNFYKPYVSEDDGVRAYNPGPTTTATTEFAQQLAERINNFAAEPPKLYPEKSPIIPPFIGDAYAPPPFPTKNENADGDTDSERDESKNLFDDTPENQSYLKRTPDSESLWQHVTPSFYHRNSDTGFALFDDTPPEITKSPKEHADVEEHSAGSITPKMARNTTINERDKRMSGVISEFVTSSKFQKAKAMSQEGDESAVDLFSALPPSLKSTEKKTRNDDDDKESADGSQTSPPLKMPETKPVTRKMGLFDSDSDSDDIFSARKFESVVEKKIVKDKIDTDDKWKSSVFSENDTSKDLFGSDMPSVAKFDERKSPMDRSLFGENSGDLFESNSSALETEKNSQNERSPGERGEVISNDFRRGISSSFASKIVKNVDSKDEKINVSQSDKNVANFGGSKLRKDATMVKEQNSDRSVSLFDDADDLFSPPPLPQSSKSPETGIYSGKTFSGVDSKAEGPENPGGRAFRDIKIYNNNEEPSKVDGKHFSENVTRKHVASSFLFDDEDDDDLFSDLPKPGKVVSGHQPQTTELKKGLEKTANVEGTVKSEMVQNKKSALEVSSQDVHSQQVLQEEEKPPKADVATESSLKSIESGVSLQDKIAKKILGKLSSDCGLNINVNTLLPGSKWVNPKRTSQVTNQGEDVATNRNEPPPKWDAVVSSADSTSGTLSSYTKERAKIPGKRRPPSRKARTTSVVALESEKSSNVTANDKDQNTAGTSQVMEYNEASWRVDGTHIVDSYSVKTMEAANVSETRKWDIFSDMVKSASYEAKSEEPRNEKPEVQNERIIDETVNCEKSDNRDALVYSAKETEQPSYNDSSAIISQTEERSLKAKTSSNLLHDLFEDYNDTDDITDLFKSVVTSRSEKGDKDDKPVLEGLESAKVEKAESRKRPKISSEEPKLAFSGLFGARDEDDSSDDTNLLFSRSAQQKSSEVSVISGISKPDAEDRSAKKSVSLFDDDDTDFESTLFSKNNKYFRNLETSEDRPIIENVTSPPTSVQTVDETATKTTREKTTLSLFGDEDTNDEQHDVFSSIRLNSTLERSKLEKKQGSLFGVDDDDDDTLIFGSSSSSKKASEALITGTKGTPKVNIRHQNQPRVIKLKTQVVSDDPLHSDKAN